MLNTKYRSHVKSGWRECSVNDLITISEGVQCSNCLVVVVEHTNINKEETNNETINQRDTEKGS